MNQNDYELKKILAGAQLPALPQSAIRLLELSQDPDNGPSEFAIPIEGDPGLTGQVLKFVNSSYFGFSKEISSVKLAITLVGIRTIKNFALWSAVFSLMPNPKCGPFDLRSLWQDSLRRALLARTVGKLLGLDDAEDLFAAALLQDMAVPLLSKELSTEYNELFENRGDGSKRLSDLERERFGWTHGEAAAFMARTWSLPEQFVNFIESHSEVTTLLDQETRPSIGVLSVGISALLPSTADSEWHEREVFKESLKKVNLEVEPLELLSRVDTDYTEFAPMLKLAVPERSLVECFDPEAVEAAAAE